MTPTPELCRRLILHFTFEAGEVPPGISGFRAKEGLSLAEYRELCRDEAFRAAVEEARERYLDTLTAGALLKKYDASFVRHLLAEAHGGDGGEEGDAVQTVEIRVVE